MYIPDFCYKKKEKEKNTFIAYRMEPITRYPFVYL